MTVTARKPAVANAAVNGNKATQSAAKEASQRQPTSPPPFTLNDIRKSIPAHCFEHSYVKSFGYLAMDLAIVASLFLAVRFLDTKITNEAFGAVAPLIRHVVWVAYWIANGCVMTGLWVIGHECGHGGFSSSNLVNDVVGWIVHSALLVPYFSWKISHHRHHANTNNIETDEVFVPVVKSREESHHEEISTVVTLFSTFQRLFHITVMLTLGWPLYLFTNATGRPYPKNGPAPNHFMPNSPIYNDRERHLIVLSDVGIVAMLAILYQAGKTWGFVWLLYVYGVPYLIVNFWLVFITFLQHTHVDVPHFDGKDWTWLRGALATVDRDYGILNFFHHHISDTHVVHHLFSNMPFYNAQEATVAVKKLLGDYYRYDNTPIFKAMWDTFGSCNFMDELKGGDSNGVRSLWFWK